MTELIYCADGNKRLAQIAIDAGYTYGAQQPGTVYFTPKFCDQNWKNPQRQKYMAALAEHRPKYATVIDWEGSDQLPTVLSWAEQAAQYTDNVLIVPKVIGGISKLPRRIGSTRVILAYSVPTRYGGTQVPLWEFAGWPVHILGGSPKVQMQAWRYLHGICDVVSADGNYANFKATNFCEYWHAGTWHSVQPPQEDAPYEAFRRSCENIMAAWKAILCEN